MSDPFFIEGTFAAPRYYVSELNPAYAQVQGLFNRIEWAKPIRRADGKRHRLNAFSCLLWAVNNDPDWVTHTILNKSHYTIMKHRINYLAMSETVNTLKAMGWLEVIGTRTRNRNIRYLAPVKSPMRTIAPFKLDDLGWYPPDVEIRRGNTDLDRAPLDVELMANPAQRKWNNEYLTPVMADLNDKLLNHSFTLFPFGKPDDDVQVQYHRIYTNLPQSNGQRWLTHGRIYPQTFRFPSKQNGWRQMTLIDGKPTASVDIHASGLRLLSEDYYIGFDLPDADDLYTHGLLSELKRDLTKKVIQAVINGVPLTRKSWPKSFKDDAKTALLLAGEDWMTYATAISETYPALLDIREDLGLDLMLYESDIIIRAMNYLLDKGIGCMSIHDCLIVPEDNVEEAKAAFCDAYNHKGYKRPQMSVE